MDEAPEPVSVDVSFASYRSSAAAKDGVLHYERQYIVRNVEIPAAGAAEFRKLEGTILDDERAMVVLKKQ